MFYGQIMVFVWLKMVAKCVGKNRQNPMENGSKPEINHKSRTPWAIAEVAFFSPELDGPIVRRIFAPGDLLRHCAGASVS
jgi:hypothetical protein